MSTAAAPPKVGDDFDFNSATKAVRDGTLDLDSAAKALLSRLSLQERLGLLDGDQDFWPGLYGMSTTGYNRTPYIHGEVKRLGIPGVRFADGPRGCVMGKSTAFPVPMARGASWDVSLEERVGRAIGRECKAQDANFFGGVCVNLPRHPAWGRIQETYGEDPVILGEMGAALTRGIQENVMACVKHYALNSMENARFHVDVKIDEAVLHEVYLAHFRRIVEEGVASVMSSYNSVRGEFAGQNKELLLDILRDQWDFKGFVISDFMFGLRDPALSLRNGLDIEAPFRQQRAWKLEAAYKNGEIDDSHIERAGVNILRRVIEDQVVRGDAKPQPDVVFSEEHRQLAREASVKSMVLLKNDDVDGTPALPLKSDISKIAVVGRLANLTDTGDKGSSAVRCPEVVSPYQGLKKVLSQANVTLEESEDPEKVKAAAGAADVTVVVVGYNFEDEGEFNVPAFETNPAVNSVLPPSDGSEESKWVFEQWTVPKEKKKENHAVATGGDRTSLRLRPQDVEVIRAAVEANPRTIVSIVAAGAVITEEWKNLPQAIILSWYSGCEGGHALADLLLGKVNFSGRLPFSIPTKEEHLPHFDKDAAEIEYDRWFGQRLLDRLDVKAAYPLGFGLSYTSFAVSDLEVEKSKGSPEELIFRVNVSNTGSRAGRYVAQVYGVVEVSDWPKRSLLGFQTVDLDAGEQKKVEIHASTRPLQRWNLGSWELVSKAVEVEVGGSSGDAESLRTVVDL
ncbi:hypothetical protein LCI18_007813 [Fusarium solani-melongenae]|uniref:Uncharacterized protein n=1 Tax=Fusarium solani subsp. cucurbitae TaxID=2747967 RepID=A0ACD3Z6K1_FUSSC|nr:hypothetical protein LCI18_007813 [Fusarium solani-melongenae]